MDRRQIKDKDLQYNYGITLAQFEARLAAQGGRCALCGAEKAGGVGTFHVDHDHRTGRIRGLLCAKCNRQLGVLERWLSRWTKVAQYLIGPDSQPGRRARDGRQGSIYQTKTGRFAAQASIGGRRVTVGTFGTHEEARAALDARLALGGVGSPDPAK